MLPEFFSGDNLLVRQAKQGKWLPPLWLVVPLAFLFAAVSSVGGMVVLVWNVIRRLPPGGTLLENPRQMLQLAYPQSAWEEALFLTTSFAGIYALLWLWARFVERRPFRSMGLAGRGWLVRFGQGFGVGLAMFALAAGVMAALGWQTVSAWRGGQSTVWLAVGVVLLGWLVQGPAEELLFRGWAMPVLGARYGLGAGVFLSALMFAVMHSLNPNLSIIAMLNLFLFGVFAAFYALRDGSVWGVFGLHAAWNWAQGNLFGMAVSGAPVTGGSLLTLSESGPDLLTGGLFGPEGGLVVTLVLLCGLAIVISLPRPKKRDQPRVEAGLPDG